MVFMFQTRPSSPEGNYVVMIKQSNPQEFLEENRCLEVVFRKASASSALIVEARVSASVGWSEACKKKWPLLDLKRDATRSAELRKTTLLFFQNKWSISKNKNRDDLPSSSSSSYYYFYCNYLGSWWSYHELGRGGWWFRDPVENAWGGGQF